MIAITIAQWEWTLICNQQLCHRCVDDGVRIIALPMGSLPEPYPLGYDLVPEFSE